MQDTRRTQLTRTRMRVLASSFFFGVIRHRPKIYSPILFHERNDYFCIIERTQEAVCKTHQRDERANCHRAHFRSGWRSSIRSTSTVLGIGNGAARCDHAEWRARFASKKVAFSILGILIFRPKMRAFISRGATRTIRRE